jgi:hypothetical protein
MGIITESHISVIMPILCNECVFYTLLVKRFVF